MGQAEAYIQTKIIKYLESLGWYVVKIVVASKSGVPDLLCCSPNGFFWAFEVKAKTKPSKLQEYNIQEIQKRNGSAFVVYSLQEVKDIIASAV